MTLNIASLSPPVELDAVPIPSGHVHVVRDDLLLGGTKQRAIAPFLTEQVDAGYSEFVYASPPPGFAQVALASTCQQMRLGCTLFCDDVDIEGIPSASLHEFSRLARSYGAKVYLVPHLHQAEALAEEYAAERSERLQLPLGFAGEAYAVHLREALSTQWRRILSHIGTPPELWLPVGSATLGGIFRDIVPDDIPIHGVDVRVLPSDDERLTGLFGRPNVFRYETPECFADVVRSPPPIPSNAFYDAKLWRFVSEHAQDGALWWNVAR